MDEPKKYRLLEMIEIGPKKNREKTTSIILARLHVKSFLIKFSARSMYEKCLEVFANPKIALARS